ncbi:9267_t:CDS:2 [Ambispora gerdemannii]|uniref:9267_t:CDS:1 n=1 Tax=Ambispora gerdemannii TaxID=144530 RepID=A0A9N9BL48_9GLOM|nr:9267_t:CDS:2 [Ambispora gerdemannii]
MAEASSSSTSRDSEPKFEDINVQKNNDTPTLIQLPIYKTLNEIRLLLTADLNIRMGVNMYFMNPYARIPQKNECKYLLSKIIYDKNNLKILDEQEPDWECIKEICKLEYGLDFLEKGPKSAEKKAFDITRLDARKLVRPDSLDETVVCQTDFDNICVKNLLVKSEVTANLPWLSSISATLGGSSVKETENRTSIGNSVTFWTSKVIKATVLYSKSEVKPTEEFIKAVDDALASDNQRKNLEKVAKEYGPLWCKKLGIGGRILSKESKEKNLNEYNNSRETKASGKLKATGYVEIDGEVGKSQQTKQMNSFVNEYSFFRMFGGLEERYHESGMPGWINSLNDHKKWAVAEYTEINSIFDILDQERRSKVAEALFAKRIVESRVETLSFRMYLSKTDPYIHELPPNLQLSSTDHIFVTVMKDDSKNLFAARVHYIDDKSLPVILIHRLGNLQRGSKSPMFTLKLGWIVIGTSTMLNLFGQPVFESDNKEINEQFKVQRRSDPNSSFFATCVSRAKDFRVDDPRDSKYIVGTHFVNNNNALEACVFCYDLQDMMKLIPALSYKVTPFDEFDSIPIKFSVNYGIAAGKGKHQFGQTQITSKSRGILGIQLNPKRFEVDFDVYKKLISQSTIPTTIPSTSSEEQKPLTSVQKILQNPVFISLVLDNGSANCVHGFFNITPKHAIFRSLSNLHTKNGQHIAYFSVD